jgi:hypothetical protein
MQLQQLVADHFQCERCCHRCHVGIWSGLTWQSWILTCDECTAGPVNVKPAAALLFKFNEGYTNAIKRPVLMHELLQGIPRNTVTHH